MSEERQGGFQLGRYHCIERLGAGALGETWRARLVGLAGFEKELAVKRLGDALASNAEFLRRFMRAASAQAALESARVVRVHEVEVVGGLYVLASELVHGLDLGAWLVRARERGEQLSSEHALLVALELVEALRYAHRRTDLASGGVLHLGLTPRQVMLTPDGEVRVLGVGLRAPAIRLGLVGAEALAPTLPFLAPEVRAARHADARADVFSVGALLREAAGETGDGRVAGILRCTLRDDPDDRCPNMQTLRDALLPLLGGRIARVRRELGALTRRLLTDWADVPTVKAPRPPLFVVSDPEPLPPPPPSLSSSVFSASVAPPLASLILVEPETRARGDETLRGWGRAEPPAEARAVAVGTSSESVPALTDDSESEHLAIEVDVGAGRAPAAPRSIARRERYAVAAAAVAAAVLSAAGFALFGGRGAEPAAVETAAVEASAPAPIANHSPRPAGITPPRRAAARTGSPVVESPAAPLAAAPAREVLAVRTEPPGAQVYVDGEPRGRTPLDVEVDEGLHAVALAADGRQLWRHPVPVRAGHRVLEVGLAPAAHPPGAAGLKVRCATRGELRIFVDGADTGADCPNDARIAVAPGRHHVTLYAPRSDEMIAVQRDVKVTPGNRSTRLYLKY